MCGIAGIFYLNGKQVNANQIDTLTDAVTHRGPDGRGIWFNSEKNLAFGHRRLSILDTSLNGQQPMSYDKERYVITLNGEIYNFLEIRTELIQLGCSFVSNSDTEVVLAAYKTWGKQMLHKFNGMWAFAIYDKQNKTLFLSRDRFGVKPLYYYLEEGEFIFSSEVQAIQKIIGAKAQLNAVVIENIVNGGFNSFGTENTYLNNVYSLPAGYSIIIDNNIIEKEKWYSLKSVSVPKNFYEQANVLQKLIFDACKIRMRSDVPVATCLSGGVDSGAITAVLANKKFNIEDRFKNYTHKGFCASFPNTPIDESADALRLAKQLKSKVDVLVINPPTRKEIEEALNQCDGPMHALAFYPIWKLYKHIKKQNITVTLDGQGPDEMLGGYRPIREGLETAIEQNKPLWFWDVYKTYAAQGETSQFSSKQYVKNQLKGVLMAKLSSVKRQLFLKKNLNKSQTEQNNFVHKAPDSYNTLNKSLYNQFFQSPLPGILQQYDRCSMANGVECRMPFMDYRIVEFVFSLPVESKVGGGYTKRILREATKGILPDETRLNKLKIGFNAPIVDWFKGELKDFMLEQMSSKEFIESNYFDGKKMQLEFNCFLNKTNPEWTEAWKFWPPVHLTWWLKNKN